MKGSKKRGRVRKRKTARMVTNRKKPKLGNQKKHQDPEFGQKLAAKIAKKAAEKRGEA